MVVMKLLLWLWRRMGGAVLTSLPLRGRLTLVGHCWHAQPTPRPRSNRRKRLPTHLVEEFEGISGEGSGEGAQHDPLGGGAMTRPAISPCLEPGPACPEMGRERRPGRRSQQPAKLALDFDEL